MLDFDIIYDNHLKVFLPEIYLITITLILLIIGVIFSNLKFYKYPFFVKEMGILSIITLFFTLVLIINNPLIDVLIFNNLFIVDNFTSFIKCFTLLSVLGCLIISMNFVSKVNVNIFEYFILILFSVFGLLCFIASFDLISMYISLEVQSLAFYILASLKRDSAFSTEAGLKYFILGAFSSGILLLGISFIYGVVGTTNFESLGKFFIGFDFLNFSNDIFNINNRIILGLICIFCGILFKLTAAPFHMWAPDVYEGSPFYVTIIFSVVPKIGLFGVAVKIFYFALYEGLFYWQSIALLCSFLSIIVGTLKALQQNKIKRFLAFSSISHVGFLLLGFATGTFIGLQSLLFYLVIYTIMILNIWSILISLEIKNKKYRQIRYINDLQGLVKTDPLLAYTFAINMFSMAGIPPLAGFFAKFYILFTGLESSFNLLVIFSILLSVVSAFYYIRFIKIIFFDVEKVGLIHVNSISYLHSLILGFTFLFITFLFLYPNPLFLLTQYISLNFFC
jgi:proton-translocating NADH-quinone oxidoreductase chain N